MLGKASTSEPRSVEWIEAEIRGWQPDHPPDPLYANATLHWLEDQALFTGSTGSPRPL